MILIVATYEYHKHQYDVIIDAVIIYKKKMGTLTHYALQSHNKVCVCTCFCDLLKITGRHIYSDLHEFVDPCIIYAIKYYVIYVYIMKLLCSRYE